MPTTYEPIATTTLGSNTATIVFSSIPSTYTDIRLVVVGTTNDSNANFAIRLNGDTGTNYSYTNVSSTPPSTNSVNSTNNPGMFIGGIGYGNDTTIPTMFTVDLFSYAKAFNKTVLATNGIDTNGMGQVLRSVGLWRNTSVVNSITIYTAGSATTFKPGTTATIYGIKEA
jgi:hypothetical protein